MIKHGYITQERMNSANTFAIVRNPYSRMFSIFKYNRYGSLESFDHFVREWYVRWKKYKRTSSEEWDTYCHVLPMKAFTHDESGKQIVPFIIRQEDLKELTKKGGATDKNIQTRYSTLPSIVLDALRGMPHANGRKTSKHWSAYYTQELMDLVYEMFQPDFEEFSYSTSIEKRPELKPKDSFRPKFHEFNASSRRLVDISLYDQVSLSTDNVKVEVTKTEMYCIEIEGEKSVEGIQQPTSDNVAKTDGVAANVDTGPSESKVEPNELALTDRNQESSNDTPNTSDIETGTS
eukprot:CAMPEP_0184009824 /NCGR_PEP_ID=MMETSP0954-20121128/2838_1 /TAXON_ID=627963 /ORGANISM="Aplanochytrium sp, Strain PBS07" /LENGTH=290 /DNA_ID=CAMNT_0026289277 /DNA_START=655 /DNA_END=1527 /DNA_ORIENTATION=+